MTELVKDSFLNPYKAVNVKRSTCHELKIIWLYLPTNASCFSRGLEDPVWFPWGPRHGNASVNISRRECTEYFYGSLLV